MECSCDGCNEEFLMLCDYVKEGNYYATTKDRNFEDEHLGIIIVNEKGEKLVW